MGGGAGEASGESPVQRDRRDDGPDSLAVDGQRDRAGKRDRWPVPGDAFSPEIEEDAGRAGGDLLDRTAVTGDDCALKDRRTGEVVCPIRSIVSELPELLARPLELGTKRAVCPRALVLKRVRVEDVDRRHNRDYADDEDADEQLQQGTARHRPLGRPAPAVGARIVARTRRRGRRRHLLRYRPAGLGP